MPSVVVSSITAADKGNGTALGQASISSTDDYTANLSRRSQTTQTISFTDYQRVDAPANGKRKPSSRASSSEDLSHKRLRMADSVPTGTAVYRDPTYSLIPLDSNSQLPGPSEVRPGASTVDMLHGLTGKKQSDDKEASVSSGSISEVDELDDCLEDTQVTVTQPDQPSQYLSGDNRISSVIPEKQLRSTDAPPVDANSNAVPPLTVSRSQQHHHNPQYSVPQSQASERTNTVARARSTSISQSQPHSGHLPHNPYMSSSAGPSVNTAQSSVYHNQSPPVSRRFSEIPPRHHQAEPISRRQSAPYPAQTALVTRQTPVVSASSWPQLAQAPHPPPSAPNRDSKLPPGVQSAYSFHLPLLRQRSATGMPVLYQSYRTFWLPRNSNYFVMMDPTHPARGQMLNAITSPEASGSNLQLSNPSFFYWDPLPLLPRPMKCLFAECSGSLEHDGFAKVLKKVSSQTESHDEPWSGFWLVSARYKCEKCKFREERSGKRYTSVIAWDPKLLARLPPTLRAEFPATEMQKRFYALENVVPPEYRMDSQTFMVSVTKSSRLPGPGPSSLPSPLATNNSNAVKTASLSNYEELHRRVSRVSMPPSDTIASPIIGVLRPVRSGSVPEAATLSQIEKQASRDVDSEAASASQARERRHVEPQRRPRVPRESRPVIITKPQPRMPNISVPPHDPPEHSAQQFHDHGQSSSSATQALDPNASASNSNPERQKENLQGRHGAPQVCIKCMKGPEECAGYIRSQYCKFPCVGCGELDCARPHSVSSGNQCAQSGGSQMSGEHPMANQGESRREIDEFYLDTSYFEEGVDEEQVGQRD
ncbi:hypothetical protein FRB90_010067 [Tulasnella sp. 427]|nr:hypothetical protein FRB90_010067 [Tulasnella sp. 427]